MVDIDLYTPHLGKEMHIKVQTMGCESQIMSTRTWFNRQLFFVHHLPKTNGCVETSTCSFYVQLTLELKRTNYLSLQKGDICSVWFELWRSQSLLHLTLWDELNYATNVRRLIWTNEDPELGDLYVIRKFREAMFVQIWCSGSDSIMPQKSVGYLDISF